MLKNLLSGKAEAQKCVETLETFRAHLDAAKSIMEQTGLMTEKPADANILNALALGYYLGKADGLVKSAGCNVAIAAIGHEVTILANSRLNRIANDVFPVEKTPTANNSKLIIETVEKYAGNWWEGETAAETEGEYTGGETPADASPSNLDSLGDAPAQQQVPQEVAIAKDDEAAEPQQDAAA